MKLNRFIPLFIALSVLCAAPLSLRAQELPPEIQFDLLVQKLVAEIEAENWDQALVTIAELKAGSFELPPSFLHFEGQANLNADNPNAAEQAWLGYLSATGREGKYYTEALAGIIAAQQSDSYMDLTLADGEFRDCAECPAMVEISPGSFVFRETQDGASKQIDFSYPFAIGKFEVTYAQYQDFVTQTGYQSSSSCSVVVGMNSDGRVQTEIRSGRSWQNSNSKTSGNQPVSCVSWHDARAYTAWLSEATGHSYRLPTVTEWHYAAMAGANTKFPCGNDPNCLLTMAWSKSTRSGLYAKPVGTKTPNAWGLHDMTGNLWELMMDCWSSFDDLPTDGGVANAYDDCKRLIAGGSWSQNVQGRYMHLVLKGTLSLHADRGDTVVGFRLVRDMP